MAKGKKRRSRSKAAPQKKTTQVSPALWEKSALPERWQWLLDSRFVVPVLLYLLTLLVWRDVVFSDMTLNVSGDRIAGISLRRIVANSLAQGVFPFWNPFFYSGMAMFESFQSSWLVYPGVMLGEGPFADPANPGFFNGGLAWLLFFNSHADFLLIHHLLGAVGMAYLVRHFGARGWVQLLAGMAFLLSPQLVVLSDVGHGSKLYAMCWLPWMLLTFDRALIKASWGRLAAVGAVFAMLMASQHIQVAYYGYMLAGFWWAARVIVTIREKKTKRIPVLLGVMIFAFAIGLTSTGVIYFNTLTYAQDTIRGGGVDWQYATNWSYHPLESISMFAPNFFGFGGNNYWGYLPFTDMPLYWGAPIAVLALIGLISVRSWQTWTFAAAGLLAWVTSFGRFAPILYRPFFEFMPYFNKFRVPMMIHILVLLGAIALAAIGLEFVLKRARSADEATLVRWRKNLVFGMAVVGVLLLLSLVLYAPISSAVTGWVESMHPDRAQMAMQYQGVDSPDDLGKQAVQSLSISLLLMTLTVGAVYLAFRPNLPAMVPGAVLVLLLFIDLLPLTGNLIHPRRHSLIERQFAPDDVTRAVNNIPGPNRLKVLDMADLYGILMGAMEESLLPPDQIQQLWGQAQANVRRMRSINTWATLGIELAGGYTGSKPSWYGYLQEGQKLGHPHVLAVMGINLLASPVALPMYTELARDPGSGSGYLYHNPDALNRVFLRSSWEVEEDLQATLDRLTSDNFDPATDLLLDREPAGVVQDTATNRGSVSISERNNNEVKIQVRSRGENLLVLADGYSSAGWRAAVNGEETDIYRANGITRAIVVPEGESEVVFRYRPANWGASLALSIVSIAVILALAVLGLITGRKRVEAPPMKGEPA